MSHFGFISVTTARRTVSVLDIMLLSVIAAALVTGFAVGVASDQDPLSSSYEQAQIYYPVEKLAAAAVLKPVSIRPATPVESVSSIKQLAKSGRGFRSTFGSEPIEDKFWLSETHAVDSFYGGRWAPENAITTPQGMALQVKREPGENVPFSIAEARSKQRVGYGRYEAVMQVGKGSGLVSAFFTYTGPYAGDPHDEVDIEFLGKDTSKVEFNYWRNGKRGKHAKFDLPFDASAAPHLYAFEWLPDRITWYVDGVAYYSTEPDDAFIPRTSGRLYFSHWTGVPKMQGWHGTPKFESGEATIVSCTSFTPINDSTQTCGDSFHPPLAGTTENQIYATLSP
jgi:endo-1,3-1,4-beta-glycanase ExoK